MIFVSYRTGGGDSSPLASGAPEDIRAAAREALVSIGQPADARAERLGPADWPRLADAIGRERVAGLRPR